jgi:hypothetical protein
MSSLGTFAERATWGAARRNKSDRMAENFRIEAGVPIPPAWNRSGGKIRGIAGVLRKLQKGDSVLLPVNQTYASAVSGRVIGTGCYATRREGAGVRVWRTR